MKTIIDKHPKFFEHQYKYDEVYNYRYGLAKVMLKEKYGFINRQFEEICPIKYDYVQDFNNTNFTSVQLNGKYGFIDKTGREICEIKYDFVEDFKNNLAKVCLGYKWGLIDINGTEIIKPKYTGIGNFNSDGIAPVFVEICEIKYDMVWDFNTDFAKVKLNSKWGFIDINGNEICPIKYDNVFNFDNNFAQVELNEKCGIINTNGVEICKLKYDRIYDLKNDILKNTLIAEYNLNFDLNFENGDSIFGFVALNNKFGVLDINGNEIIDIKYDIHELKNVIDQYIKNKYRNLKLNQLI